MSEPELVSVEPATTAVVHGAVAMTEIRDFFDDAFGVLAEELRDQGVASTGPAYARYFGRPTDTVELEVGFPTHRPIAASGSAEPGGLPGGQVARLVHHGGFDGLDGSWDRLLGWAAEHSLTPAESFWEVYRTEPSPEMDPDELRTELNLPLA